MCLEGNFLYCNQFSRFNFVERFYTHKNTRTHTLVKTGPVACVDHRGRGSGEIFFDSMIHRCLDSSKLPLDLS